MDIHKIKITYQTKKILGFQGKGWYKSSYKILYKLSYRDGAKVHTCIKHELSYRCILCVV